MALFYLAHGEQNIYIKELQHVMGMYISSEYDCRGECSILHMHATYCPDACAMFSMTRCYAKHLQVRFASMENNPNNKDEARSSVVRIKANSCIVKYNDASRIMFGRWTICNEDLHTAERARSVGEICPCDSTVS